MIESLRAFATSWVAKLLLVLLVASFAVFGVRIAGFGASSVAQIGSEEISIADFTRAYRGALRMINQQRRLAGLTDVVSGEQAAAAGVHVQVTQSLMRDSALAQELERLGLDAPDAAVRASIESDPQFQTQNGFSGAFYDDFVRSQGFRKTEYEALERKRIAIGMLSRPVARGLSAPEVAATTLWRRDAEARKIGYLTLTPAQIAEPEDPGDAVLRAHHENNAPRFTTPERRKIDLLMLRPEDLADPGRIEEERLRRAYAAAGAQFNRPEQRNIERLDLPSREEAQAVAERARGGVALADIAAERGMSETDVAAVSLGYVAKAQLETFTPELADPAFAAAPDAVLDPIEISGGFAVLKIAGVAPGRSVPFESVKDRIALELAVDEARRETASIAETIEDALAGGASFDEIAEQRGVSFLQLHIDAAGRDPEGRRSAALPAFPGLLEAVFEQAIGEETDLTQTNDQAYWTAVVTDLEPDRLRPFEEAREEVLADWRREDRAKALEKRAQEAAERLNGGDSLEIVAGELGVEVETVDGALRQGGGALPQAATQAVFALGADQAVGQAVVASDGPRRLVLTTLAVETPNPAEAEGAIEAEETTASLAMARDLQALFDYAILTGLDSEIDQAVLNQAASMTQY